MLKEYEPNINPVADASEQTEKILFVDDEPNILAVYRRKFRNVYHVEVATSGEQALSLLNHSGPYAVIIADMNMPGMNGVSLLNNIHRQGLQTVPIMLTGNSDQKTAAEAVNLGKVFRFHTKPCPPNTLVQSIEEALENYRSHCNQKTEKKNLLSESATLKEQLTVAIEEAHSAQAARKNFLSVACHELKTPVNHIVGFSELMTQEAFGPLAEKYKVYAAHIKSAGDKLSNRIESILEFTQLASHSIEPDLQKIKFSAALDCVTEKLQSGYGDCRERIKINNTLPDATIEADPKMLERLLHALLDNALKFSPPATPVHVSIVSSQQKKCMIDISNHGPTLSEAEISCAFEPLRQRDMSFTRATDGLGMGLSVARSAVELHGGQLWLSSAKEEGVTAHLVLPLCQN